MGFRDRKDAGRKLSQALEKCRGKNPLVLAIPKGGIEVGLGVARHLGAEFSVIICRKLPFPYDPEAGFGALAEDGTLVLHPDARQWLSDDEIQGIEKAQEREIRRRMRLLRGGAPLPPIGGRTVILVDDGLAMGSTMKAAVGMCRKLAAGRIVVAVPVASEAAVADLRRAADDIVVLEIPPVFQAVALAYVHWTDVTDHEAVDMLEARRAADDPSAEAFDPQERKV